MEEQEDDVASTDVASVVFNTQQMEYLDARFSSIDCKFDKLFALISSQTEEPPVPNSTPPQEEEMNLPDDSTPENVGSRRGSTLGMEMPTPFVASNARQSIVDDNEITRLTSDTPLQSSLDVSDRALHFNFPNLNIKDDDKGTRFKAKDQPSSVSTAPDHSQYQLMITQEVPDHSFLMLKNMEIENVISFVIGVREWHAVNAPVVLPPSKMLTIGVRNMLAANMKVSAMAFGQCSHAYLFEAIMRSIDLSSPILFVACLTQSLTHVSRLTWDKVAPSTHESFFKGFLYRKERFLSYFTFLRSASPSTCPKIINRKEGCVPVFLSLFDKYYVEAVLMELPPVNLSNYKGITEFVDKFATIATNHHTQSRSIKNVPYVTPGFHRHPVDARFNAKPSDKQFGSQTECKSAYVSTSERYQSNKLKSNSTLWNKDPRRSERLKSAQSSSRVAKMGHDPYNYDSQEEMDYVHRLRSQEPENEEDIYSGDSDDSVVDNVVEENRLAAFTSPTSVPKNPSSTEYGCLQYALNGQCSRGSDCHFKHFHNAEGAKKTHKYLLERINSQSNPS
jgi:hypothetical protein